MSTPAADDARRLGALERENRLLKIGVGQLTRIREQWTRSLDELKAAKAGLQASNQFLDRLLRTAPLPVMVLAQPWLRIVLANAAAEALFAAPPGALLGRRASALLDPSSRAALRHWLRQTPGSDTAAAAEVQIIGAGGQRRTLELHATAAAAVTAKGAQAVVIAQDVTERRDAERRLRLAGRIIDSSPQGIAVLDADFRIVEVNPSGARLLDGAEAHWLGQPAQSLLADGQGGQLLDTLGRLTDSAGQWQGELRLRRGDHGSFPASVSAAALHEDTARVSNFILMFSDITERKHAEQRLRFHSLHDALTGLPNRVQFRDRLEQALDGAARRGGQVGVAMLDLDGFKHVNDAHGHDTGDELLKQVAQRLRGALRSSDTVARFGGDEFAAILPDVGHSSQIGAVADKIRQAVGRDYLLNGEVCKITASIGVATFPADGRDIDTLLKYADMAMYKVKAAGKDAFKFFSAEMDLEVSHRANTIARMTRALEHGEFVVHYQPQVEVATRRVVGVEALVRWNDPSHGLVQPGAFIGLAEETGLINPLGAWVLRQACTDLAHWHALGLSHLTLAVNLSARQFGGDALVATVGQAIADSGINPARLELEVTESTVMESVATAERVLRELGRSGVSFALDDFGTGYACMAYLKQLPFSRIKIDRQFVRDLETDAQDMAIADAIIRMGSALGLSVVAEGVETEGQLRRLQALGCRHAQGYLFARPMPADQCLLHLLQASAARPPVTVLDETDWARHRAA